MTARDLACRALWTEHPLCSLFAIASGTWRDGAFEPARSWSLRQLIAFAEQLPPQVISNLSETDHVPADHA